MKIGHKTKQSCTDVDTLMNSKLRYICKTGFVTINCL